MTRLARIALPNTFASASTTILVDVTDSCKDVKTKIVQKHGPSNAKSESYVLVHDTEVLADSVLLAQRFQTNVSLVLQLGEEPNKPVIPLHFGDQIMLAEIREGADKQYIGAVTTEAGVFACSPLPQLMKNTSIYRPSLFTVVAPGKHHRQGSQMKTHTVCYGDEIVLVDRAGLVWNNNSTPASVDFRARGAQGEMFLKFEMASCYSISSSSSSSSSGQKINPSCFS